MQSPKNSKKRGSKQQAVVKPTGATTTCTSPVVNTFASHDGPAASSQVIPPSTHSENTTSQLAQDLANTASLLGNGNGGLGNGVITSPRATK